MTTIRPENHNPDWVWDIEVGGIDLLVDRDTPHVLSVHTYSSGEQLDIDEVDKLYEVLGEIRAWMKEKTT